jgi:hypothetical protein
MASQDITSLNPECNSGHSLNRLWIYLTLSSGMILSWLPLFGQRLPFADDYAIMHLIDKGGLIGYFNSWGFWRPLGHIPPIWLLLRHPFYTPLLVLFTLMVGVLLLFELSRTLFGGIRLPLVAALTFAMFPFGFQAMAWTCTFNYIAPTTLLLANLLILANYDKVRLSLPLLFGVIVLLSVLTNLGSEIFFFTTAFSGCLIWVLSRETQWSLKKLFHGKHSLAFAPVTGCIIWYTIYSLFKGQDVPKHITTLHWASILSPYFKERSMFDTFSAWFSPVCREFLFYDWDWRTFACASLCCFCFLIGLNRLSQSSDTTSEVRQNASRLLFGLIALLLGSSLIYVLNGGFSPDSRKKYPLIPILALAGCFIYRSLFNRLKLHGRAFFSVSTVVFASGALTVWLVLGIWKYQTNCYNTLADFIANHNLKGPLEIKWSPDLVAAWPKMGETLGYRFGDDVNINYAVEYRGGCPVVIKSEKIEIVRFNTSNFGYSAQVITNGYEMVLTNAVTVICYDANKNTWRIQ